MSQALSPVSGRRYGLAAVCRVWRVACSGVYRHLPPPAAPPGRPGPVGPMADAALIAAIRVVLAASPFHGEGHRKVWVPAARRRHPHLAPPRASVDARERVIGPDPGWIGTGTASA